MEPTERYIRLGNGTKIKPIIILLPGNTILAMAFGS